MPGTTKLQRKEAHFTYWENKLRSRIDLGKRKYGGSFSEEDVENVKAFLRIVAVLLSTFGFFIPYYHALIGLLTYVNTFEGATSTLNGYGSFALWQVFDSQILLLIPVLELIIIPLFPKIKSIERYWILLHLNIDSPDFHDCSQHGWPFYYTWRCTLCDFIAFIGR